MSAHTTLTVAADTSAFSAALAQIELLAEAGQIPLEVAEELARTPQTLFQIRSVDREGGAARGACDLVVALEPSDRLLDVLPALRGGAAAGEAQP